MWDKIQHKMMNAEQAEENRRKEIIRKRNMETAAFIKNQMISNSAMKKLQKDYVKVLK
jgi:hypothetical protein